VGGEHRHEQIMFYRRDAQLSGFLIGFAVELAILTNQAYFIQAVRYAIFLTFGLALVLLLAYAMRNAFLQGLVISGILVAILLLSSDLRPIMQTVVALPFLGAVEIALFLIAGLILARS
jgi:hypothetical protein